MSAKIKFKAKGHKNILAAHKTTLEFTKEKNLTTKGDCIVGVEADYDLEKIRELVKRNKYVKITIKAGEIREELYAETNPGFNDETEMVIRLGEYESKRTFATNATKAAKHLSRKLKEKLKEGQKMEVQIEAVEQS